VYIIGTYTSKVDSKNRFSLPVGLKKQLPDALGQGLVIKPSIFVPCLEIYTQDKWKEIMLKLGQLNRFVRKHNDFIRTYMSGAKLVDSDSSDRFVLAKELIEFGKIDKNIVLSSAIDYIELWSEKAYEQQIQPISLDEDFQKLAEEIMSNPIPSTDA